MNESNEPSYPVKDPEQAHRIATVWRPVLREIAKAVSLGDFGSLDQAHVDPLTPELVKRISTNVSAYGETLMELPDEAWQTSVCQWMETYWEVLVDLWTEESGSSDLVLSVRVFEANSGFRFAVDSVHVP